MWIVLTLLFALPEPVDFVARVQALRQVTWCNLPYLSHFDPQGLVYLQHSDEHVYVGSWTVDRTGTLDVQVTYQWVSPLLSQPRLGETYHQRWSLVPVDTGRMVTKECGAYSVLPVVPPHLDPRGQP